MSAIVCGKRSFYEDLPASPQSASPPVSKRLRYSNSTSPVRFSPLSLIDQLRVLFPNMDNQVCLSLLRYSWVFADCNDCACIILLLLDR